MNDEQTAASPDQIHVKLTIPSLSLGFIKGAASWSMMFGKIISRALQDKGIYAELPPGMLSKALASKPHPWLVMGLGSQAIGIFGVTNRLAGLVALREELDGLGLLECSQIAWFEIHEQVWMPWYPEGSLDRVESNSSMILNWLEIRVSMIEDSPHSDALTLSTMALLREIIALLKQNPQ